jgi:hypothetical protein
VAGWAVWEVRKKLGRLGQQLGFTPKTEYEIENLLFLQNLLYFQNSFDSNSNFKWRMTPICKIKYKDTHHQKIKYALA